MGYKRLRLPQNNGVLPNGLILISGKNSYGKSTILEGILIAFFGPGIILGRNQDSFITYNQDKAKLYVYFTLDNVKYYIFRTWKRQGSASSRLFRYDNKSQKYLEVKKFNIEKFFEISKEQAMNTVFVRQGEVEELANKRGAKLRDMIIDLFRLNIIDDSLKYLDTELKSFKIEKSKLEKSRVPVERIEEDVKRINQQNEENKKLISHDEITINEYKTKFKNLPSEELISNLENMYKESEVIEGLFKSYKHDFEEKIKKTDIKLENFTTPEKIATLLGSLKKNKKEIETKKKELEEKRKATIKGMGITKGRIDDIKSKIDKMKISLTFQKKDGKEIALCPTCQSELTMDHYNSITQGFNRDLETNQNKLQDITQLIEKSELDIKPYQDKLDNIIKKKGIVESLKDDFENYQKHEKESMQIQNSINDFLTKHRKLFKDSSPEDIKSLSSKIVKLNQNIESINRELLQLQENLTSNKKRIEELLEEIEKMKELEKKIGEIEINIDHATKAKEFVRRFVTEYMVAKRLVKNIALMTDKYIKSFTSGQYSDILLEETGTTKTGLSLRIRNSFNNQDESIEVLSGGDRTALGMALRLAISELMSKIRPTKDSPKRNPKIDFLLLDEPLAALDETRRERVLKYLIKSKAFSQIFLITHTAIPAELQMHKIIVEKDHSTGISSARFEKQNLILS